MSGVTFQQLAWVVSFALFSSLLVALTLIPMLSSRMVRVREPNPKNLLYPIIHGMKNLLEGLDDSYARGIRWALRHRAVVAGGTLALVVLALGLIRFIGFELEPETDEGEVRVSIELPAGSRLEATDVVARKAEELVVRGLPELASMVTEVGSSGGWQSANTHNASLRLILVPKAQRARSTQQIAFDLRPLFADFPGVVTRIRASGSNRLARLSRTSSDRLGIDMVGHDLARGYHLAVQVKRLMESTDGISDASIGRSPGRPETRVVVDRAKVASLGLSVSDIANNLRTSIGGTVATRFREKGEEYDILVRYQESDRLRQEDVLDVPVQTPSGRVIPLGSLVKLDRSELRFLAW